MIDYSRDGPIVTIRLNRPEKLNALDAPACRALAQCWLDFEKDPEARVAILVGTGRAFCAGLDLSERSRFIKEGQGKTSFFSHGLPDLVLQRHEWDIPGLTKPLIAAVNGLATGIGTHLVMACDLRVASDSATFGLAEVNIGRFGAAQGLSAQGIPLPIAMELAVLGETIDAKRAYEVGLVNRLVAPDRVLETALDLARRLALKPPKAVSYNKLAVLRAMMPHDPVLDTMVERFSSELDGTGDHREAVSAFLEKRPGRHRGE